MLAIALAPAPPQQLDPRLLSLCDLLCLKHHCLLQTRPHHSCCTTLVFCVSSSSSSSSNFDFITSSAMFCTSSSFGDSLFSSFIFFCFFMSFSFLCPLSLPSLKLCSKSDLVSVPNPKPTPVQITFSILQAIHVPDEVWGRDYVV